MIEFIKANKIGATIMAVATVAVVITAFVKRDTIKGYAYSTSTTENELEFFQKDIGGYAYDKLDKKWVRNSKGGFVRVVKKDTPCSN